MVMLLKLKGFKYSSVVRRGVRTSYWYKGTANLVGKAPHQRHGNDKSYYEELV